MSEPISIDEVNRLQEENEAYKQSELEAAEIIAELENALTRLCYQQHGDSCRIYELKESKFKSTLEEIREMCNKHLDAKEICYATQVIDKISEVLE